MDASFINSMSEVIADRLGEAFQGQLVHAVSGGCINRAGKISDGNRTYFFKMNRAEQYTMLEAESRGLALMAQIGGIAVPKPLCVGVAEGRAFLVMEWFEFQRGGDSQAQGRALAAFHRAGQGHRFGLEFDNFIGSTSQLNTVSETWSEFFLRYRLDDQVARVSAQGGTLKHYQQLRQVAESVLSCHKPVPSFVHGDLWSGNVGFLHDGQPCIFDPAPYYGDREVDLAMSELFGGFNQAFYEGYESIWPTPEGRQWRRKLYNLFHILNHFVLFGGSYLAQANQEIEQLLQMADKGMA